MKYRVLTVTAIILGGMVLSAQKPAERPFDTAQGRPDTILVNGKILSADSTFRIYEALAISGDRITAAGTSRDMRALADAKTRVIDLGGRTVIPGMTDSHMHAIRAGLSFATEVHWIGAPTIENALGRLRDASKRLPAGAWLIVAGGWTERQFADKRRPTPKALEALKITRDEDLPPGGKLERDGNGTLTGGVAGPQAAIVALFGRLPKPAYEQQIEGTKKFFLELNRLGLTGVIDPGGNNITPPDYEALFEIWRENQLTVRVAFSFGSQGNGGEFDEITEPVLKLPIGIGDNMLRFNGVGERITGGLYNNDKPTTAEKEAFEVIA